MLSHWLVLLDYRTDIVHVSFVDDDTRLRDRVTLALVEILIESNL